MNPFHTEPDLIHTEDYAVKKDWLELGITDFENCYKYDHIIDFNEYKYYMVIENQLMMIRRNK